MAEARRERWMAAGAVVALALFNVYHQVSFMDFQGGLAWYERVQWERTQAVMAGEQGTPWQYRLFTDGIVYATVHAFETAGVPRPVGTAFVLIRSVQNLLFFTLALLWFRRLGIQTPLGVFGLALMAWGMGHGLYDTDMTFNTYTDLSIFLGAALLLHHGRDRWLIPLMVIAAFNRETSGCIPFMLLFARLEHRGGWRWTADRHTLVRFAICLGIWLVIVGGMRLPFIFGVRPYIVPTAGASPPIDLLVFNLTWWRTYVFLFATLGLLPLIAVASYRHWPHLLQRIGWAVVPVWFPIHFTFAHAPETRLFFVPQALVFVPGALLLLAYGWPCSAPPRNGHSEAS